MWDQYCAVPVSLSVVSAVSTVAHYVNGKLSDTHRRERKGGLFDLSNSRMHVKLTKQGATLRSSELDSHKERQTHFPIGKQ